MGKGSQKEKRSQTTKYAENTKENSGSDVDEGKICQVRFVELGLEGKGGIV